jgi:hypothetical protein
MQELLKKLLAAEVLTEETKQELEAAFKGQLDEAIQKARSEAQASVTQELNEAWLTERDTLIEALDAKVTEALTEELNELRGDIDRFRDLEAEYAEKMVEAKGEMAKQVKKDVATLIESLDTFLEVRIASEMEELREDIATVKKNEFGKKVFESFVSEFKKHYAGDDTVEAKLTEAEGKLAAQAVVLKETQEKAAKLERSIKMEKVLAPLSGRTKEVMEAILKTVDTALLEDTYKTYIGRVLKETSSKDVKTSEKEDKVLAEGEKQADKKDAPKGVVKTGDDESKKAEQLVVESAEPKSGLSKEAKQQLRRSAGLF